MVIRSVRGRAALLALAATLAMPGLAPAAAPVLGGAPATLLAQRPAPGARPGRAALEAQLQQRLAEITQRELQLTDAELGRLQAVNRRFDVQRRALVGRERQARMELRRELEGTGEPDQRKVEGLVDQLLRAQGERLRMVREEQRALAEFLTPVQRARYLGLQEGFHRRLEERRRDVQDGRAGAGARRGAARGWAPPPGEQR